jgi:FkbM family methyltransferase
MLNYIRNRFHPLWRLRKFRGYRELQRIFDFAVPVKIDGFRFWVMFLRDFAYVAKTDGGEPATHQLFKQLVRKLGVTHVFDIGANVGSFAWNAVSQNPAIQVYLFEPDRQNIRLLKRTISSNELNAAHLWEGVVSNCDGEVSFLVDDASGATGSIVGTSAKPSSLHSAYGMRRRIAVPSTTLDSFTATIKPTGITLLKIDVEGAEAQVLDGAKEFIARVRPLIVVECFVTGNLTALKESGYLGYMLPENHNYLMIPSERLTHLLDQDISPSGAAHYI